MTIRDARRLGFLLGMRAACRLVNRLPADDEEADMVFVSTATDALCAEEARLRKECRRDALPSR